MAADDHPHEPRWPPAATLLVFMALNVALRIWLPKDKLVGVAWALPVLELVLLIMVLTFDPTSPGRRSTWERHVARVIVCILVVFALLATALLVYHLIIGAKVTQSAGTLLAGGALVWLGNNVAFAFLYWLFDGDGPVARARHIGRPPRDFAFTQHLSPELAPERWRPVFLDYLHLGFTNATAFSPTDVMPLSLRAKYAMLLQATTALALFGLVVARAVNVFV